MGIVDGAADIVAGGATLYATAEYVGGERLGKLDRSSLRLLPPR